MSFFRQYGRNIRTESGLMEVSDDDGKWSITVSMMGMETSVSFYQSYCIEIIFASGPNDKM
jgi:hypothetical protein